MVVLETIVRLELLVISKGKKKKKIYVVSSIFIFFRSKVSWTVGLVFAWLLYIYIYIY